MRRPRFIPDPASCNCGLLHPAYADCDLCRGHGTYMGSDQDRLCFVCRERFARETGWLDAQERELDLSKESALE